MASVRVDSEVTRIMIGVNESSIKGYPHASISSKSAFEWTLNKIIRSNTSGFKLLFLHVQVPDEDGIPFTFSMCFPVYNCFLQSSLCFRVLYGTLK